LQPKAQATVAAPSSSHATTKTTRAPAIHTRRSAFRDRVLGR
jgi:hypothetical protein